MVVTTLRTSHQVKTEPSQREELFVDFADFYGLSTPAKVAFCQEIASFRHSPIHSLKIQGDLPLDSSTIADFSSDLDGGDTVGDETSSGTTTTSTPSFPCHLIWDALQELTGVEKFEYCSGWYEDLNGFERVPSHWPLHELELAGAASVVVKNPQLLRIASLVLDLCHFMNFELPSPAENANLRKLVIIENDAVDNFLRMHETECLLRNLESLRLQSTAGNDLNNYDTEEFATALQECISITSLDLSLNFRDENAHTSEHFIDLPRFFPAKVETLRFNGPPALASHLSVWRICASSSDWLPHLHSFGFSLAAKGAEGEDLLSAADRANEFIQEFVALHPSVKILT